MKTRFLILFLVSLVSFRLQAAPKVLTMEEREVERQIEAIRKAGFSDIEIDNLHASIAENIFKINKLLQLDTSKKALRYIGDEPQDLPQFLKTDRDNKAYLEIDMGSGESFWDFPKTYLYNARIFIYPGSTPEKLDKIIMQFKRTNSNGEIFVREMRRVINLDPKGPQVTQDGKRTPNNNKEIKLEYYSSYDTEFIWPDTPTQPIQAGVESKLHDEGNPLPYNKQKQIILTYKKYLRKVDKNVRYKLRDLDLNQKRLISKMLEFQ
ncbi:hypothetical protein LEP1GSC047_1692 [Leptospira inadai serovar Lyme str. 10]|uniref:Uncharacterized protein n=2 Tax=Leptospira inadai serovar Lyme TaxID=293084 RepID=V6H859_9LEPT|nr:hypothetical protein [Leptospira inadai]EQA35031.1 hypothetical protein LEP1GSC047_1692 [Leptospira inadai serovar Lyme str. 10]PNV76123.1 hypothetical protein BES34_003685 [Leptospira inadai serovar Lyme]